MLVGHCVWFGACSAHDDQCLLRMQKTAAVRTAPYTSLTSKFFCWSSAMRIKHPRMKAVQSLFVAASSYRKRIECCGRPPLAAAHTETGLLIAKSINAWSVNGADLNSSDIASTIFSVSLLPYLAFLYFLSRKATKTPDMGNFGFQFLLVFVFATIPAGIIAKQYYHDILANVDVLHGVAESLLTVTNLLIIGGFQPKFSTEPTKQLQLGDAAWIAAAVLTFFTTTLMSHHMEPGNALSLPTWAVHTSSVLEWLIAMNFIWQHADAVGNPRWKGLTWAMLPAHASGLCACVYHFFYNAPAVQQLVALQAALTLLGNTAMAAAAWRIYNYGVASSASNAASIAGVDMVVSNARVVADFSQEQFWGGLLVKAVSLAVIVKYGELLIDTPFHPTILPAFGLVTAPTVFNIYKWKSRSMQDTIASSAP